jgi:tetratricopeptide (TPR) repeat protein
MKKYLLLPLIIGLFCVVVTAQNFSKPTLTSSAPTAAQNVLIQQGTVLHDKKQYEEAIEIYQKILDENPDCTIAMYEMSISYKSKGDTLKAIETAAKGTKYRSSELPLFYILIANTWDEKGNPKKAIDIYQETIKILKDEKNNQNALSSVYYNLGVTYTTQKQYKEAKESFKKAVEYNYGYASPNYLLAEVFYGTKYKVPAMLAAARLVSLEINTPRAKRSVTIFLDVLKAAKKDEKTGNINIFLDMNAPKDEGDFGMYDLILGTLTTVKSDKDKNKSDEEVFAEAFDTLIALLSEDKKLPSTFVGKNYIPFLVEMKKKGYSKIFAYLILQQDGNEIAKKWLLDNSQKAIEFIGWAKEFRPTV